MEIKSSFLLVFALALFNVGFSQNAVFIPQPRLGFGILSPIFGGGNKSLSGAGGQGCLTLNGLVGTCVDFFRCSFGVGSPAGKCGFGLKVCCLPVSPVPVSSLVRENQETRDSLNITRISPAFCQVRVDFTVFSLDPVDRDGICTTGSWTATGQRSDDRVPTLCGFNSGQHLYMNFDAAGTPITMQITTSLATANWNIQTTQIACYDQQNLAPNGCLQFFPNPSGNVKSFSYQTIQDTRNNVTFQPANLNYIVCISRPNSTFSSATWTRDLSSPLSFTISRVTALSANFLGTITVANFDAECNTDFVRISNGQYTNDTGPQTADKFCGSGFPNQVVSTPGVKPFALTVFTNARELDQTTISDSGNVGFSLNYILS